MTTATDSLALELKLLGRAAAAARGFAILMDEIKEAERALLRAMIETPCSRASSLEYVGDDGTIERVARATGTGEECWIDRAASERPRPGVDQLDGYCDACRARAPLAKRVHELRIKKGGAARAVAEAGRALRALRP